MSLVGVPFGTHFFFNCCRGAGLFFAPVEPLFSLQARYMPSGCFFLPCVCPPYQFGCVTFPRSIVSTRLPPPANMLFFSAVTSLPSSVGRTPQHPVLVFHGLSPSTKFFPPTGFFYPNFEVIFFLPKHEGCCVFFLTPRQASSQINKPLCKVSYCPFFLDVSRFLSYRFGRLCCQPVSAPTSHLLPHPVFCDPTLFTTSPPPLTFTLLSSSEVISFFSYTSCTNCVLFLLTPPFFPCLRFTCHACKFGRFFFPVTPRVALLREPFFLFSSLPQVPPPNPNQVRKHSSTARCIFLTFSPTPCFTPFKISCYFYAPFQKWPHFLPLWPCVNRTL